MAASTNQSMAPSQRFAALSGRGRKHAITKLEKIEASVAALSDAELKNFAAWFADYQWERWDRQLEHDMAAGKLDKLADQALADFAAGHTRPV